MVGHQQEDRHSLAIKFQPARKCVETIYKDHRNDQPTSCSKPNLKYLVPNKHRNDQVRDEGGRIDLTGVTSCCAKNAQLHCINHQPLRSAQRRMKSLIEQKENVKLLKIV